VAGDLVQVIEAAYALHESEADWVEAICSAVRPALDVGLGVLVATVDISSGNVAYSAAAALGNTLEAFLAVGGMQPEHAGDALLPIRGRPTKSLTSTFGDRLPVAAPTLKSVTERFGVRDVLGVIGMNTDGHGMSICVLLPKAARLGTRMRNRWDRIAAHLAAGVRLRRRTLPAEAPTAAPTALRLRVEGVDALLTSDGRIAHAVGTAREAATREQLRAAAVAVDRARSALRRKDPDGAVELWRALVDGRWSLVDRFDTDGRRFLVAQRNEIPTPKRRGLRQREAAVLALRAQGHSLKLIGYELGVGQSIVARDLALGMKRLGLESIADLVRLYARPAAASE
jgi:DNA-binding CsgD family transcriptional regulator